MPALAQRLGMHRAGRVVVFLFLPAPGPGQAPAAGLDLAMQCVEALARGAAQQPLQLYCCHAGPSVDHDSLAALLRSATRQRPGHRHRSLCADADAADSLPLLALREWLCDDAQGDGAEVAMLRYAGGERRVLQPAATVPLHDTPRPALEAQIEAFENGRLSKDAFGELLRGLEVDRLDPALQQRIVQAIERVERRGRAPAATAVERILASVEKVLGLKPEAIDFDRPLQDYGMDSIASVRLTAALEKEFGCPIAPASLVEHPTMNALAARLGRELAEMP
jgi:acyl carrier protein